MRKEIFVPPISIQYYPKKRSQQVQTEIETNAMNNQAQPSEHSVRSSARLKGEERDSEAQPTGEDKIINQGFQCPIGKKEELFNPGLEKRSCNIIPLGRSTYQSARLVEQ